MHSTQMKNDHVTDVICEHIDENHHFFVFPSEVAGEFRQRDVLLQLSRGTVRRDRFISWDRLKEREFSPAHTRQPANAVFRLLFAAEVLGEHRQNGPVLYYLMGDMSNDISSGFQRQLSMALPQLQRSIEVIDAHPGVVPSDLEHDLRELYTRYCDFLDRAGLFEPAFVPPQAEDTYDVYHIFYPELIEDYSEYQHLIEGNGHFISYFSDYSLTRSSCVRFQNARQELEYVITSLHGLLDSGAHPADIAITLPNYEAWAPYLREEAEIRNIPLDFRSGRTLSEYPAGRLFTRLAALSVNGFGLEHLKRIVLEPAYPLASGEKWRELIGFAIEHYYVRSWKGDGAAEDELDRKLKLNGRKELRSLYRNFRHQTSQLMNAPSFQELLKRVHKFIRTFFKIDGWDPETEKVLQYCLLVLRELREASEQARISEIADPYSLWITLLNQRIYVSAVRKEAVPVYQYRVSAGITPKFHFIPGAGQNPTRVRHEELTFLRDDYRSRVLDHDSKDMSGDFIAAYSHSGSQVVFSCSDLDFSGPQLPPGELLSAGIVTNAELLGSRERETEGLTLHLSSPDEDIFVQEENFWNGSCGFPARMYPVQQAGFLAMKRTAFRAKGKDYSKEMIDDPGLLAHLLRVGRGERGAKDERLWFSPSAFDQYAGCPFQYLLNHGLKISESDYLTIWYDPMRAGTLLHQILSDLYIRVQEKDGRWKREDQFEYRQIAKDLCKEKFTAESKHGNDFIYPIWKELEEWTRKALELFVEQESKLYHGYELLKAEGSLSAVVDEACGVHGRVDRVSCKQGHAVIVDYKKGFAPKPAEVYQADTLPLTSQLPLYAYAMEQEDFTVSNAAYYSFKEGKYKHMLLEHTAPIETIDKRPKTMVTAEEFQDVKSRIIEAVRVVAEHFKRGDFRSTDKCDGCEFRAICRQKYTVRIPEVKQHA